MKTENKDNNTINRENDLYYLDKEQRNLNCFRIGLFIVMMGIITLTFTTWFLILVIANYF